MKSLCKRSVFVVTALSMASGCILYSTKPALSGKSDNLSIYDYCSANQKALTGSMGWSVSALPLDPKDVFSWRCRFIKAARRPLTFEIDLDTLNTACAQQYPDKNWVAKLKDMKSAFSWYCDVKK